MKPASRRKVALGAVLIVEDEVLLAEMLADALRDGGAGDVRCVTTATEALAQLSLFAPAVIVLDVQLADGDDGWLMAEIAQQLFARMPLLVFATGSPERIPARVASLGLLVTKPYDAAALVETIRVQLQQSRRRRLFGLI